MVNSVMQTSNQANTIQPSFFQYSLVVNPTVDVHSKVVQEKELFSHQFGGASADLSAPRILLATFKAREEMEETIIRYLHRICSRLSGFVIELNNYSGYPPNSVFLRVQNPQTIFKITSEFEVVNTYIGSCGCPPLKMNRQPHITIANSLNESLYLQALMEYGQKSFHEIFMVNELLLVRKQHTGSIEKSVNIFRLKPVEHTLYN